MDSPTPPTPYHTQEIAQVLNHFACDENNGLSSSQVATQRQTHGPNALDTGEAVSLLQVIIGQSCNAMIMVMIIAMCVAFGIRDWISAGVIAGVVAINIVVGVIQQYNAEKTLDSLKNLSSPSAQVIRDGKELTVESDEVVPGDIVLVKVGDTIPADFRLISGVNFETDEALLTGESLPVVKDPATLDDPVCPVGDRVNMAFSSSVVSKGRAKGVVTSTGMNTEIGTIAKSLQGEKTSFRKAKDNSFKAKNAAFWGTCSDYIQTFLGTNTGTPLQIRLAKLAVLIFVIAVIMAIVVMAAQKFDVTREVAIYAVAVAVSMIPASLVVVLTITMAVGTKIMVKRNVIVRKLDSLEALGAVNDICSDKTGTLTQGKMVARKCWVPSLGTLSVQDISHPYNPTEGTVELRRVDPVHDARITVKSHKKIDKDLSLSPCVSRYSNKSVSIKAVNVDSEESSSDDDPETISSSHIPSSLATWLYTATLANIAELKQEDNDWIATGDPTEIAIQVFTSRLGFGREKIGYEHIAEHPFDSTIKRMSAVYTDDSEKTTIYTKGAVERVLECCTTWIDSDGATKPFTSQVDTMVQQQMDAFAKQGLRVLAFATRPMDASEDPKDRAAMEKNLTFLGLVGIYDPPRVESAGAVAKCHRAGINVHMLTGDHPGTARAIAEEVGILPRDIADYPESVISAMVMTAMQFDALTDEQIDALPVLPLVIARCSPTTKVRMIDALHRRNRFTAMTGDGVNDSPSLAKADVGIAMGIAGSDVAKDASDIVLSDDNFASILNAVEEGRRMADNIQKFVLHLLAANVAFCVFEMVGLVFMDDEGFSTFPISPIEILWCLMVTSALPAMGLGLEEAQPDLMDLPPRDPKKGVFSYELLLDMMVYGLIMAGLCLGSFAIVVYADGGGELGNLCNKEYSDSCHYVFRGRSVAFAEITWFMLFLAWEVVDMRRSVFIKPPKQAFHDLWRNQLLFWSVIGGFFTVFPCIYIPVINDKVFLHKGISWEWGICFAALGIFLVLVELWKWGKRVYFRRQDAGEAKEDVFDAFVDMEK
ncbi:Sodium transport ATPase 5 [Yarrowia sp. B02]|nr:Sodium transport ATPase 5 [Yarrowia sp. B02]